MTTAVTELADASLLRRFSAWIYDLFLLFAVGFAYAGIVLLCATLLGVEQDNLTLMEEGENMTLVAKEAYEPAIGGPLFQAGLVLVLIGFYVLFWIKRGATLGMQTWRMELITLDGSRPSFKVCVLRAFLAIASFFCLGLGYFWSLYDAEKRTAHDILTGTRVVVHPKQGKR